MDHTQHQSTEQQKSARDLSLGPRTPPAQVQGYTIETLLGSGAYGEVWVALDQRTGRRVAIKFYTRQGAVDLSLLSREVEKLVFLSADRYVVQLLDVGWDATPPHYVMDYIENGSLEDQLQQTGTLPVDQAVEMIGEIGIGLMHLHGKGILHCDLKPGNVLLDQDHKPRLADFGQSRLSHELAPALGTLFFMAPEQADLQAAPDARWDVYALGALLYCMLTGHPPFRDEALVGEIESPDRIEDRLQQYRRLIDAAPRPVDHRRVPGVDRALADIIDRCIARDPSRRFESVQSVLQALDQRQRSHSRRPLVVLGLLGPLLLLAIMSLFAWNAWRDAVARSEESITEQTIETNHWIAQLAARSASEQVDQYFRSLRQMVSDPQIQSTLASVADDPEIRGLVDQLADPGLNGDAALDPVRQRLIADSLRQQLQGPLQQYLNDPQMPAAASWFFCDFTGTQIASEFRSRNPSNTIGKNFAWRSYFTGRPRTAQIIGPDGEISFDIESDPARREHIEGPNLSAIFQSKATNAWKIAVSAPVMHEGRFVGIAAVTADVGSLVRFRNASDQYVMIVDGRQEGDDQGTVLEHPLLRTFTTRGEPLPASLSTRRVDPVVLDAMESGDTGLNPFRDPMADDPLGSAWDREQIAAWADVQRSSGDPTDPARMTMTGLKVIAVADRTAAMLPAHNLGQRLAWLGTLALLFFVLVSGGLLFFVIRSFRHRTDRLFVGSHGTVSVPPSEAATLLADGPGGQR